MLIPEHASAKASKRTIETIVLQLAAATTKQSFHIRGENLTIFILNRVLLLSRFVTIRTPFS